MTVLPGGIILAISFGVRATFGGVVQPISDDLFSGRIESISLSIAIQNLVWGLAQPVFGLIADRYGDRRALVGGLSCYAIGLFVCVGASTPWGLHIGAGLLVGMGISGTAFGVVLAAIGRIAPEEQRGVCLGVASALGSAGQFVFPLLASWLTTWLDWRVALAILAASLIPMALCIPLMRAPREIAARPLINEPDDAEFDKVTNPVRHAFQQRSYLFLTAGFFVCGFHLAYITAHLPNYVLHFCSGTQMSATELQSHGLQALAIVGLANIFGTLLATYLGERFPKPAILSAIYALRAVVIVIFISLPITPISLMVFAFAMGMLWLSTVPLTSGLVLAMYGPRLMGTLFGFVFLGHQLGGFVGVWLAGAWFDWHASYDMIWYLAIGLGVVSSVLHLQVKEGPAFSPAVRSRASDRQFHNKLKLQGSSND